MSTMLRCSRALGRRLARRSAAARASPALRAASAAPRARSAPRAAAGTRAMSSSGGAKAAKKAPAAAEEDDEAEEPDVEVAEASGLEYASFSASAEPLPWGFVPQEAVARRERELRELQNESVNRFALSAFLSGEPMSALQAGQGAEDEDVMYGTMQAYRVLTALFASRDLPVEEAEAIDKIMQEEAAEEEGEEEEAVAEADTDAKDEKDGVEAKAEEDAERAEREAREEEELEEEEEGEEEEEEEEDEDEEELANADRGGYGLPEAPAVALRPKMNLLDRSDLVDEGLATLLEMQRDQYNSRGLYPEVELADPSLKAEILAVRTLARSSEDVQKQFSVPAEIAGPVAAARDLFVNRKVTVFVDVAVMARERMFVFDGKGNRVGSAEDAAPADAAEEGVDDAEEAAPSGAAPRLAPAGHILTLRGERRVTGEVQFTVHNLNGVVAEEPTQALAFL